MSSTPFETDVDYERDYSQGEVSQVIQQLLQSGVDINAKDIRVCAVSAPQEHCDMEGLLFAKLSHRQFD